MLFDPKWKPQNDVVITRTDLTDAETKALLWVREALLSGKISTRRFQMDTSTEKKSCGAVGCIGGWMGMFMAMEENDMNMREIMKGDKIGHDEIEGCVEHVMSQTKFYNLFFPYTSEQCRYNFSLKATPTDGVKAIDNFLQGAEFPWKDWETKDAV